MILTNISKKVKAIILTILSVLAFIFIPYLVGCFLSKIIDLKDIAFVYWAFGFAILNIIVAFLFLFKETYEAIYKRV
jgi:hypothetical protein